MIKRGITAVQCDSEECDRIWLEKSKGYVCFVCSRNLCQIHAEPVQVYVEVTKLGSRSVDAIACSRCKGVIKRTMNAGRVSEKLFPKLLSTLAQMPLEALSQELEQEEVS